MKSCIFCAFIIALLAPSLPASAAVTTNLSIPTNLTAFVPCANGGAGEDVDLSGPLHVLLTDTVNGNNVHASFHFNPQDLTGIGTITGTKYQGTGVTRQDVNASNVVFPANLTFINNFRIIGRGPSNNLLVHETLHVTINANGAATAVIDHASVSCR